MQELMWGFEGNKMNQQDYINRRKELIEKHKKELKDLNVLYAIENNPVKTQDFVSDCQNIIKVDLIHVSFPYTQNFPSCRYSGVKCTEQQKPFKSGEIQSVFQYQMIEHKPANTKDK